MRALLKPVLLGLELGKQQKVSAMSAARGWSPGGCKWGNGVRFCSAVAAAAAAAALAIR